MRCATRVAWCLSYQSSDLRAWAPVRIVFSTEERCWLLDERPRAKRLQLHQRQSKGTRAVGCCGDQAITGQRSASRQARAQAQRNRGMGDHAEDGWLEAVPAEVVISKSSRTSFCAVITKLTIPHCNSCLSNLITNVPVPP